MNAGAGSAEEGSAAIAATGDVPETAPQGSIDDFDFLVGRWRVRHRRLVGRLVGSTTWEEFDGECAMQKMLGGQANVDDNVLHAPAGTYHAIAVRVFDPEARAWSIFWIDSRYPPLQDREAGRGRVCREPRGVLLRRRVRGASGSHAVHLAGRGSRFVSMAAGALGRRRAHVGDQLVHGLPPARGLSADGTSAGPAAAHRANGERLCGACRCLALDAQDGLADHVAADLGRIGHQRTRLGVAEMPLDG